VVSCLKRVVAIFFLFAFPHIFSSCKEAKNSLWEDQSKVLSESLTFESEYMAILNQHRLTLSLKPLIYESSLRYLSLKHSEAMAAGEIPFGHTGFSKRCQEAKVLVGGGNLCAENVAMGQKSPQTVFAAWLGSSGHRANIEQSRFTHTGISYKRGINGNIYWTQIFIEKD